MKPIYQKLLKHDKKSILFDETDVSQFSLPWHFHPEIEIIYIYSGSGTLFLGNGVTRFNKGDVFVIGENIAHQWKCDLEQEVEIENISSTVHFPKELFLGRPAPLPYLEKVTEFIPHTTHGIRFFGNSGERLKNAIEILFSKEGLSRITDLILLLDMMATEEEYSYISNSENESGIQFSDFERFNKVHGYIVRHFRRKITLNEVARLVNITPTAFCRYFKYHTGKTLATYINEFRIDHACSLLKNSGLPIAQIAKDSGFNNISNFNEQFRKYTKLTPIQYKKQAKVTHPKRG